MRQDSLDQFVWDEMIRLLDDAALIQAEIDRRREAARQTNPLRKREEELRREQTRLEKSIERLISAYQEGLVTLPQLRQRTPELRRQMQAVDSELHSLEMAAVDDARYLQLAETLATFRGKLRVRAGTLDVRERQQILRLLVKEILVGSDTITIRHSIPTPPSGPGPSGTMPPGSSMIGMPSKAGYLLRTGSQRSALRRPLIYRTHQPAFHHSGFQKRPDQLQHPPIADPALDSGHQFVVRDPVEKLLEIQVHTPAIAGRYILLRCLHRLMRRASGSKPVAVIGKRPVPSALQHLHHRLLDESIQHRRDAKLSHPPRPAWGFPPASPAAVYRSRSTAVPEWLANAVSGALATAGRSSHPRPHSLCWP